MEPQQQQQYYHQIQNQQHGNNNNDEGGGSGTKNANGGGGAGYLCRQNSTRWTPTTEQIRILKELYYNNGVRSPTAEQIQRISAKLRQYGKIEGKNVFYWFQNHKARERQKKRLTTTSSAAPDGSSAAFSMQMPPPPPHRGVWRSVDNNQCSNHLINPAVSPGVVNVGQIGNYGYGNTLPMERSFRERSNYAWIGVDHPYSSTPYYPFLDKIKTINPTAYDDHETLEDDEDDDQKEPETLPLFPVHADHHHHFSGTTTCFYGAGKPYDQSSSNGGYYANNNDHNDSWYRYDDRASLELSLNSYNIATSSLHFP